MILNRQPRSVRFNYQVQYFNFYPKKIVKAFIVDIFHHEGRELDTLRYVFCTNEFLLSINQEFLQHDDYTDIITFNYSNEQEPVKGECYISVPQVRENAAIHKVSFKEELLRVIIHGALHLCGYDDKNGKDQQMRQMEDRYIRIF